MRDTTSDMRVYEDGDKGRKFCFILWKDTESYNTDTVLTRFQTFAASNPSTVSAFILHDKDVDDDGVLKKPHYHCLLKFENRRSIESVYKHLGVEAYAFPIFEYDSLENMLLYFLHFEN